MNMDLRKTIEQLEKAGLLKRIKTEVDPYLEITEITDRVSKKSGHALLFENVKGSEFPVLTNTFGSKEQVLKVLGIEDLEEISQYMASFLDIKPPGSFMDKLKMLPKLKDVSNFFPKDVSKGACQEVVITGDDIDLEKIPVLTCWPEDGGPFVTLPCVFTRDPKTNIRNCGMYRLQRFDKNTTGMHWHLHKHGAGHYRQKEKINERIEVAVAIGGDPAVTFAATVPLPEGIDEMIFAGFLRKSPVEMVKCKTVNLDVPADSEFVLEGYVKPHERRVEGPFGDHTGFYSLADDYPVFHVTAITHRKNAIYQATVVGRPPMEDCHMGFAIERIMLPLLQKQFPEIIDMHMPFEGVFHNLMILSIDKTYPGHARKIMHGIWGLGQAMFTKCIVVVDSDVNIHDYGYVAWRVLNNIDPERDIEFVMGPVETLDHASRLPHYGSKMGIDGTQKWKTEGFDREWPNEIVMSQDIQSLVDKKWKEYGIE
ncbi:MAG: menaquinone biosynthesis decarboxylase [Nitrospinae bacterium]|nr:menaquinone biosynthesis decarboxylase [Nitrospinota bacterium]